MRILLFGAGMFYRKNRESLGKLPETAVIGILDNDPGLWGREIDGIPVYAPEEGIRSDYERILLMSVHGNEMDSQLQGLGVPPEKILRFEEYQAYQSKGKPIVCYGELPQMRKGKGVLVITTDLGYNGGSLAAVYAVAALKKAGYSAALAAPSADGRFLQEIQEQNLAVILDPCVKFKKTEEMDWLWQFDQVLVNTFQMYPCVLELCRKRNTVWWLHEAAEMYESVLKQYPGFSEKELAHCKVMAVCDVARGNLERYFPNIHAKIMPYGIPDTFDGGNEEPDDKVIFAVIGSVCRRKGQDVFIRAVDLLTETEKSRAEFWIVGKRWEDEFGEIIEEMTAVRPFIQVTGEKSREEMAGIYRRISVVVVPSLEDMLPMVAAEGMMWKKVCIVSEVTGMAGYIKDGENGLLCRAGDAADLSRQMKWVLAHRKRLITLGKQARITYEQYFAMEIFSRRLEQILME